MRMCSYSLYNYNTYVCVYVCTSIDTCVVAVILIHMYDIIRMCVYIIMLICMYVLCMYYMLVHMYVYSYKCM